MREEIGGEEKSNNKWDSISKLHQAKFNTTKTPALHWLLFIHLDGNPRW